MMTGETQYKGAANYIQAFTSGEFWNSVWVTLLFTILSLVIQLPLGVLVALLLNQEFKGRWLNCIGSMGGAYLSKLHSVELDFQYSVRSG